MKSIAGKYLLLLPLLLGGIRSYSQQMDAVITAVRAGSASQLARYFDNYIDLSLPDKSNSYSKTQAEIVLKDFFTENPVKGFEIKHRGENAGSQFCIGVLNTKNGRFRVTLFLKQKGGNSYLQEIRMESGGG